MTRSTSWKTATIVAPLAAVALLFCSLNPTSTSAETAPASQSDLPYTVHFEQGATKFTDGDNITITEVHGTAETFIPGNIYSIKGTYKLASHEHAILLASVTVVDEMEFQMLHLREPNIVADYISPGKVPGADPSHTTGTDPSCATGGEVLRIQRSDVSRGTGTFTLFLPMTHKGLPHVSFCSTERYGLSFGGNYFGTGDSVLKQWWGEPANPSTTAATATQSAFPYTVHFEQGATQFADGDNITITEVHGTAENFIPGNIYWVKGTYTLASHDKAMLAAYTTARDSKDGYGKTMSVQETYIDKGSGTFTLFLPMTCSGWPHVSMYGDGQSFSGNYFGTGDSLLKQWWGQKPAEKTSN